MKNPKLTPITRLNKFYSHEDQEFQVRLAREMIEGFQNFTVILYRVNRDASQFDELYGESALNGIRFYTPIELKVLPIMAEPENKAYNQAAGTARYLQDGQLTFYIYEAQLHELKVDIAYGDYIGYPVSESEVRYFSVSNDGKKNFDNKHTIMGYRATYRTIVCAPVDNSEFKAE